MEKMIELNKAKAVLNNMRKQYAVRIKELEAENQQLRSSNRTPSYKNDQNYHRQLDRVIKAGESGELQRLGRSSIKKFVNCGDDRAQAIQVELVNRGLAEQKGRTIVWAKRLTQAA